MPGVKQGDSFGPLFFCLAIHDSLLYRCLLIGRSTQELFINGDQIPFINYVEDAFRFLGCWLGNVPKNSQELSNCLEKIGSELNTISSYDIEKHIKFFVLKICYSGKITHLLRSTAPSVALNFCRSINELRINFCASLLEVDSTILRSHLFTSASILCKSAFLGGGNNFVFEFDNRFPNDISLINPNSCKYLCDLNEALIKLPFDVWSQCFPESVSEIPERCLTNLQFCLKKLQQELTIIFEILDYNVRLGMVKEINPAFANFLTDVSNSSASCLITQIPQVYGLLLDDNSWSLNMRLRSCIWPDNLRHNLKCQCGQSVTPTHLLNCNRFISFRSKVHDSVRDQLYCMCKSYGIVSF
ncbi:hypothetical protein GEMRC1_003345 [Eukaryota sp. GEM-RC1]